MTCIQKRRWNEVWYAYVLSLVANRSSVSTQKRDCRLIFQSTQTPPQVLTHSTILHGANKPAGSMPSSELFPKPRATCEYCSSFEHHVCVNQRPDHLSSPAVKTLNLDWPSDYNGVLLKVVKVLLHNGKKALETYSVLDDGSQCTILLQPAAQHVHLEAEKLSLRTVSQDVETQDKTNKQLSFSIRPEIESKSIVLIAMPLPYFEPQTVLSWRSSSM